MDRDLLGRRVRDGLYSEAMLLADELRSYLDGVGRGDAELLGPLARVRFSCESLKTTTRVMHVVAWLMTMRAVDSGEIAPVEARLPARRLGEEPALDRQAVAELPPRARALAEAGVDLFRRVAALGEPADSPARLMQDRLRATF